MKILCTQDENNKIHAACLAFTREYGCKYCILHHFCGDILFKIINENETIQPILISKGSDGINDTK